MAATASIVIEVQDAQATAALQRLNAQVAQTGTTLQPVQRISEQTFNNIEGGALKARESAALLGEEFGVKIPRALRGTIAQSSLLGPIFTAAFSGLAVLGFIEIVKVAVEKLTGFGEALKALEKQNTELVSSAAAASKTLLGPQTLEQVNARILETTKTVGTLNTTLGLTGSLYGDALTRGLAKYNMQHQLEVEELDKKKSLLNDLYAEQAKLLDEERRTEPVEILKLQNAARINGLVGIAKINEAERGETAVIRAEMEARITTHRVGNAEITELARKGSIQRRDYMRSENDATKQFADQALLSRVKGLAAIDQEERAAIEREKLLLDRGLIQYQTFVERKNSIEMIADSKRVEMARAALEETTKMEEDAAVAMLPPWQRSYAQIAVDTQNRLREIQRALDETRISGADAARQIAATWQMNFAKMRDQLAGDLENLFDNITSGNIGKFFLQQFKHLVFQMVASWILGMQQMKGASQQTMSGSGGILGAIFGSLGLGGIFGGGGGGQAGIGSLPGVITNFGGGGGGGTGGASGGFMGLGGGNGDFGGEVTGSGPGSGLFGAMGLSSGKGAGTPGLTLPAGAGPAGSLFGGGLPGIAGGGGLLGMLGIGLLAASFRRGGVLGGLGGALGGALLGGTYGGPIGGIIGGILGFILGIFGKSTKKARLAIEADIKRKAATIEDAFNLFQMDWMSSRDALEQLRQAGVDALKQAGVKDISRSRVGHVDQWIDKAEKEIDVTQAERNRRGALTFGPAQFRVGGFVGAGAGGAIPSWFAGTAMHFAGGGAVPAILHEGEYVMRPEAVSQIGRGRLDSMNSGRGGGGNIIINISAMDAKSFEEHMRGGGTSVVVKELIRARNEGML
jgi:hypothetical protein